VLVSTWTYRISVTVLILLASDNEYCCWGLCCTSSGVHGVVYQYDDTEDIVLEESNLAVVGIGADGHICSGREDMGCSALKYSKYRYVS
jgi:hypothetical protein